MTWWDAGLPGLGAQPPLVLKKNACKGGPRGALKISQVLNCERLHFLAEVLKLGGVKKFARGA